METEHFNEGEVKGMNEVFVLLNGFFPCFYVLKSLNWKFDEESQGFITLSGYRGIYGAVNSC